MKLLTFSTAITLMLLLFSCEPIPIDAPIDENIADNDTIMRNVSYGSHPLQKYDIHLPTGHDNTTPVIIMLHGGAWKEGAKENLHRYVKFIKSYWHNIALVNMNYRLVNENDDIHHDEIMSDINDVIQHIIDNQETYNISTTNMGIMGVSAGGQLAMIYAYKYNNHNNINCVANISGPSIINDWDWYDSDIPGYGYGGNILTGYVGQPWDNTLYESVSPYWNITSTSQPLIAFHGTSDLIVPIYQSRQMHDKLNENEIVNELHEYNMGHVFPFFEKMSVSKKLVTFFYNHIEGENK